MFTAAFPGEIELTGVLKPGASKLIRAVVADDYPHMQQALVSCLESMAGIEVVGTAVNGREALDMVRKQEPGLAVIDLQMPVLDGFKLLRELRKAYPTMHLVAVSGHFSAAVAAEAISAGADAFVAKNELPHSLFDAVTKLLS